VTADQAKAFAVEWASNWNSRDVERVLAHFDDDIVFTSPTAQAVVGVPTVRGKTALRNYWNQALARIRSLRFTVDRVVWDEQQRELAIIYISDADGAKKRISENLRFNEKDVVVSAEVFHGVGV
jgi:ketosteroid isomerase-like protein